MQCKPALLMSLQIRSCIGAVMAGRRFAWRVNRMYSTPSTNEGSPQLTTLEEEDVTSSAAFEKIDDDTLADLLKDIEEVTPAEEDLQLNAEDADAELELRRDADSEVEEAAAGSFMKQKTPNTPLHVPELVYRPRVFLYGSLFQSAHPKEAAEYRKELRKSATGDKKSFLVPPKRMEDLIQWCNRILPAVPTDDVSDIQSDSSTTSLPLVSHLYVVEDPETVWKAYEKKFRRVLKKRSAEEVEMFQSLAERHSKQPTIEIFPNLTRVKDSVTSLLKQFNENIENFSRCQQVFKSGVEKSSSSLPLNNYPLTLVVASSLAKSEANKLQHEIEVSIEKNNTISKDLIERCVSKIQVWVLTSVETVRWREALIEGELGFSWPDYAVIAAAMARSGEVVPIRHKAYVPWEAPPSRPRHQDPAVVVHEREVVKALKLIRQRKEDGAAGTKPPSGLFPLEAKVCPKVRTTYLSDRAGLTLPSLAHLFVVDAAQAWNALQAHEEGVTPEEKLQSEILKWATIDGRPLIFDTTLYKVTIDDSETERVSKPGESKGFPEVTVERPEKLSGPRDAVIKKLMSHFATFKMTSKAEENDASSLFSRTNALMSEEAWKNNSLIPTVFVFKTNFEPVNAWALQRFLNRAIIRFDRFPFNKVCVLSKTASEGNIVKPQTELSGDFIATPWASLGDKEHIFPLTALRKREGETLSQLLQPSILVDPLVNRSRTHSTGLPLSGSDRPLASDTLESPEFFIPLLYSLEPHPVGSHEAERLTYTSD